jgi:selenocysteine lyase/cysteine desulfurase
LKAMQEFVEEWRDRGTYWEKWLPAIMESRKLFGKLIGAEAEQIACTANVTTALAAVATGMKYKPDGNIVITEMNFPTNIYMWHLRRRHGYAKEVRMLKQTDGRVPLEEFEKAVDDSTSIVSFDYVSHLSGCRQQVREIAEIGHRHGALVLVDAFQALGAIPIDVRRDGVDILVSGSYKWLMGPHSVAYIYVRRDLIPEFSPTVTGWWGVKDTVVSRAAEGPDFFDRPFNLSDAIPSDSASRFEWGTPSVVAVMGAKAALEFCIKYQAPSHYDRILKHTDRIINGLKALGRKIASPLQPEHRSGIVVYRSPHPYEAVVRFADKGISVSGGYQGIRVSPHYYNTDEEIQTFLDAAKSVI